MPDDGRPTRVGCVFRPQHGPELLPAVARAADTTGLHELWLWEDCFLHGGIAAAAVALAHNNDLTVGIGGLPVPMRSVVTTAMEIATCNAASPAGCGSASATACRTGWVNSACASNHR